MKITKKSREILTAVSIGDGYVNTSGGVSIRHCLAQKDYLIWKSIMLRKCGYSCKEPVYVENNKYGGYETYVHSTSFGKLIRSIKNNSKDKIPMNLFKKMTKTGLAIWYMDDGSLSHRKDYKGNRKSAVITISTCTTKSNNQDIIDHLFEEFGVKFTQRKMKNSYSLTCGAREGRKFIEIIKDTVNQVPSMKYKIDIMKPKRPSTTEKQQETLNLVE